MLRHLPQPTHADLLVGIETGDDAVVWRRPDGRALVATADFFTPIVDDARTWGRIAATNAASDVYAMGGTPLFGLNLAAWPKDQLDLAGLGEVLAGGAEAAEGRWVVAGGHTVDGAEPFYGQSIIGEIDPDRIVRNRGARPGEAIVLTKALGTGIVTTALKRSSPDDVAGGLAPVIAAAVASMCRHNDEASTAMLAAGASAGTDVTGFGLLGHLGGLVTASGVSAVIDVGAVPVLADVAALVRNGFVPGGTERNLSDTASLTDAGPGVDPAMVTILADAQTSGGLVFTCDPGAADEAVDALVATGHAAAVIGEITAADGASVIHLR